MSGMNPFLAEMYETRSNIGAGAPQTDDAEKLAQAHVLNEYFSAEGVDLDQLDDDAVVKVANAIFGANSQFGKVAMEEEVKEEKKKEEAKGEKKEEDEEDTEEKLAQADLCGRVMAHAFMQERSSIEKQAAAEDRVKEASENGHVASALDALAQQRAEDMLKQAGMAGPDPQEQLNAAVDQRALEMLKAAGYNVG